MSVDILTMGRVIVDLYALQRHTPLSRVDSFQKYLGGSAGNMAVGLARLGARTGLISRVGRDEFGQFLLDNLAAEGVDTAMVRQDPACPTPLAFAAIFPPGDSRVLFYGQPPAFARVEPQDLDQAAIAGARILVLGGTALCASPARESAITALETVRAAGGVTAMDVDWRPSQWDDPRWAHIWHRQALRLVDIVLANETELELLGGTAEPAAAAAAILAQGPRLVIAKRGGQGVQAYGDARPLTVAPFPVEVANTLGAGDGFGAGFCYGLLQKWHLEHCLTFACACGALVVSRHSCSAAMPTRAEVVRLMAEQGRSY